MRSHERGKTLVRPRWSYRCVLLTHEERERLLFWLHKPVPPGPAKDLDVRLIRKLS